MIHLNEYLNSKLSFAQSRKAKYTKSQESFKEFKDFFEKLGEIPGLEVGMFVKKQEDLEKYYRFKFNDFSNYKPDGNSQYANETKALVDKLGPINPYVYATSLYEIRENEPDKIVVNKTYKWFLNDLFSEEHQDIHRVSDCSNDKWLVLGKFDKTEMKQLDKWGFVSIMPYDNWYRVDSADNIYWAGVSDKFKNFFENNDIKNGNPKDPEYLTIDFKTLLDNIKYIKKQFFEIVDDE